MIRRITTLVVAALLMMSLAVPAFAAPLPDNCTKDKGTVSCFDGPGKNRGGVGDTTTTKGNTENDSPEPQDLGTTCRPAQSQGVCG